MSRSGPGAASRLSRRVAAPALLTYAGVATVAAAFADDLIFLPPSPSYGEDLPGLVTLDLDDGASIAARWVERADAPIAILFAHGNAEDIGHGRSMAERLGDLGAAVLAFDYPGYGLSSGRASEEGAYAAIDAAYTWLVDRAGFAPERIVVHGRSLGAAVAVDLAARQPVGGVVIESGFVSAYRVMTRYPILPIDQFTSLRKLGRVSAPVLVIHGELDAVIAPWHGRRLYAAVPEERRTALWVEGAGHNDLAWVAGAAYWDALRAFGLKVAAAAGPG